jgi:hypothetical protein
MFAEPTNFLALLVASMANWLGRHAAAQLDYLQPENRALRTRLACRRIVFTDAERRTLGTLANRIGIKALRELDPIVSPSTLLRWHWDLMARKWTFLERRSPGMAPASRVIEQLVLRMANENPSRGYTRIQGALQNLGMHIGRGTIRRILKDRLIETAPTRGRRIPWSVFLKAHWRSIAASDFYIGHYRFERNHQGLDNQLVASAPMRQPRSKRIQSRARLGGMLRFYERAAP